LSQKFPPTDLWNHCKSGMEFLYYNL
jgi:hypothetical protein